MMKTPFSVRDYRRVAFHGEPRSEGVSEAKGSLSPSRAKRALTALSVLLLLQACGFTPLHSQEERGKLALQVESVAIAVDSHAPSAQLLKAEIEDNINPVARRSEKLFTLDIRFTETEIALFINPDGTSGRGDYQFNSAYTLTRRLDGKLIDSGQLNRVSSFNNAQTADFSTFISREDARKRGIAELAQDYKLRIANLLPRLNDPTTKGDKVFEPKKEPQEQNLRNRMSNSLQNSYETNIPGY